MQGAEQGVCSCDKLWRRKERRRYISRPVRPSWRGDIVVVVGRGGLTAVQGRTRHGLWWVLSSLVARLAPLSTAIAKYRCAHVR